MAEIFNLSFTLDEESFNFLNEFKAKSKVPKSIIVREALKYFNKNQELLKEILWGETI